MLLASLVFLITLALTGVLGALFTQYEEADIGHQFHGLAVQTTETLDRTLFERYREVQVLANQPRLGNPDGLDEKRRLLEDMQKTYPYYAWLGLTDEQGKVLVSANRLLEGANVAQRPWFRRAFKDIHLTDVHSAALLGKLLKTDPGADAPRFVDIAFPYRDPQGRIAGVFGVHLSLAWAADIENSVMEPLLRRQGVETLILAKDMTVILGPKHLVGTRFPMPDSAGAQGGLHGYVVERLDDGRQYLIGYSKMRGYRTSPGLDWTVVVRQDTDFAYAPVMRLQRQVMLTGGAITLAFALLGWWLSRRITRPIIAIAESAQRIEAAQADHIDAIQGGYREIGVLRTALQSLIGKLGANEAALKQASRRKDEFLATLAHELRNPLAPIAAGAGLLRMGRMDAAQQQRMGEMVARQTQHMTSLIDDLLDVSLVTRGHVRLDCEPVALADVVAHAIEQTAPVLEGKNHHLRTDLAQGLPMVMGDQHRLVQVLANLLDNAARYTPPGGRIALTVSATDTTVRIVVRDNGIGMSASLIGQVFELFTQETRKVDLSKGGLGVGLALAKRLVEYHGGTLAVSSAGEGRGSEFVVTLPAMAGTAARAPATPDGAPGPAPADAPLRVLIVDDNEDAADALAMLVESLGFETLVEYDGPAAIERARQAAPRICLLDIGMPGMDGYVLAGKLRELPATRHACIVAVTGYSQPADREYALQSGFDAHMTKPVDSDRLAAMLDRITGVHA